MPSGYKYNCTPAGVLILTIRPSGSQDQAKEKLHFDLTRHQGDSV